MWWTKCIICLYSILCLITPEPPNAFAFIMETIGTIFATFSLGSAVDLLHFDSNNGPNFFTIIIVFAICSKCATIQLLYLDITFFFQGIFFILGGEMSYLTYFLIALACCQSHYLVEPTKRKVTSFSPVQAKKALTNVGIQCRYQV